MSDATNTTPPAEGEATKAPAEAVVERPVETAAGSESNNREGGRTDRRGGFF